jgi:hypothetical protein
LARLAARGYGGRVRTAPLVIGLVALGSIVALDHASLAFAVRFVRAAASGERIKDEPPPEPVPLVIVATPVVADEPVAETEPLAEEWGEILPADEPPADDQDEAPADEPPAAEEEVKGEDVLVSIARETWIFAEPRWRSRRLGYLRAGSVVSRSSEPATKKNCPQGWYRVAPRGFVCVGPTASLDPKHPIALLTTRRPSMEGLPYLYALSRFPTPPLYARMPSRGQQQKYEPERAYHMRKYQRLATEKDFVPPPAPDETPPLLAQGVIPALGEQARGEGQVIVGNARVRSGFALLGTYLNDDRQFGLTTDMALVPLDRMRMVQASAFHGVTLSDELGLPLAVVRSKFARSFAPTASGALGIGSEVGWRSFVGLTGQTRGYGGQYYYEAKDGSWVRADQIARIEGFTRAPKWAQQGKKWIDVSILRQSLVAYEGTKPVYATLVSTGADGIADHEKTHATIQGTFLIHTKHISVTMDGDDRGDEFDLRDVPFVQYFTDGYALHGAYWHDDFGTPRSHGCVNLSPTDAAWLFNWTDPVVPEGWHAALSLKKGTIVYIHP